MKNKKYLFITLLSLILLVSSVGIIVFGGDINKDSTVTFDGSLNDNKGDFVINPESTDLFQNFKQVMPGDTLSQDISVKAINIGRGKVTINLKTRDSNIAEEKEAYNKLLNSKMSIDILKGSELLKTGDLVNGVSLTTLKNNEYTDLTVKLNIPIEAGNEIAGLKGAIDWIFTANYTPYSGGGGGSIDIPDDPIPESAPNLNSVDHYSYIIGYDDGTVKPEGNITRAEVATIFFRLLTDEAREQYWSQSNTYTDCDESHWFNNAVSTLSNMGVIKGYPDGTFKPNDFITRAEFSKIAVSFFKTQHDSFAGYFIDVAENDWYAKYVEAAVRVGLIVGFDDKTFKPEQPITRAESCAIVNRTIKRRPNKEYLLPVEEMITWPDNQPNSWYYVDMQEATNSHDYEWFADKDGKIYEKWTKKLPQRDWADLEKIWSKSNSSTGTDVINMKR